MLKIDLHVHTLSSGHGFNTLYEIAKEASRRKMSMIGIADHGPAVAGAPPVEYFKLGYRLPERIYGVRILFGVELNILDKNATFDLEENTLKVLTPVLAGFHRTSGYVNQGEKLNTMAMINAIRNPYVQIISHPFVSAFPVDVEQVAEAACKYDKLLELNCSLFKYMRKISKDELVHLRRMIQIVKENSKKLIANSDGHVLSDLGDDSALMKLQKELGFTSKDLINNYPEELKAQLKIT